jgi:hypothetical protein
MNIKDIIGYNKCDCGAITLYFAQGDNYTCSIKQKNLKYYGIDLRKIKRINKNNFFCCDHCVNHYGVDLCSCGSGEKVGKCSCGSTESSQVLGENNSNFFDIMRNLGQI